MADSAVVAALGVVLAVQNVGEARFDTKLDLIEDPWGFLARAINAWDPSAGFGQVQNQAYGYLFPIGPAFGLMHSLGLPAWIQQWLWAWALVALAYIGMRLVITRMGLPGWTAIAGALAYALAPRVVTVLGPLSAEVLAASLVPWVVLPLLRSSMSLRRTAFKAALPVLFMGAANATLTISVLVIPLVWILVRAHGRWRLLGWWTGFVAAFSLWWVVPLLIQGRYATPFLSFIESARNTTRGLRAGEALRGDVHWVAGIVEHGAPWWPTGYVLATSGPVVLMTFALAGIGLAGVASPRMPEPLANGALLLIGLVILAAGSLAAPFHEAWWALLDGSLAPFRNVHKFDPVLRFPLSIGIAAACAVLGDGLRTGRVSRPSEKFARMAGLAGVSMAILVVTAPLVSPGIAAGKPWREIPPWWAETAAWLERQSPSGRALLVPGSGFGQYLWGRTIDEPLQTMASVPWAVDNGVPLGSVGTARVLDSISSALARGQETAGLAELLARSGVSYVVVRNDLDSERTLAPSRSVVAATLQKTPGLSLVASFGEVELDTSPLAVTEFARDASRPAVEVYKVLDDAPMVEVMPMSAATTMTGGPEALLTALSEGTIESKTPVIFADDAPPPGAGGPLIITDTLLRRDRAHGRGLEKMSAVHTAQEESRVTRKAADLVPFASPSFTVAEPRGFAYVSASTAQSYGDSIGALRVDRQPFAALDELTGTWWQSSSFGGPAGQWWEVGFLEPKNLNGMTLDIVESPLVGSRITSVELVTDRGRWREDVPRGGRVGPVQSDSLHDIRFLRITASSADGRTGSFAIRNLAIPDFEASLPLLTPVPPISGGGETIVQLKAYVPLRTACVNVDGEVRCDPQASRPDGEGGRIDRLVTLREEVRGHLSIRGVVRPGPAAAGLFDPLGPEVRAYASSWLSQDLLVRPGAAVDGNPATAWVASIGDPSPSLSLRWGVPRVVDGLRIRTREGGQPFAAPQSVRIRVGGSEYVRDLGPDGRVTFPGVEAMALELEVLRSDSMASTAVISGTSTPMPVHVAEVEVSALSDLVYQPDVQARTGTLCGFGPALVIDGKVLETRVDARLGRLLRGDEVSIVPCDDKDVALSAGTHRITIAGNELVDPLSLTIAPALEARVGAESAAPTAEVRRSLEVVEWGPTWRSARVGPGPESIMRVAESSNQGWQATLDGQLLTAVRLDGWQQGWVVPEGQGGHVVLDFVPQSRHFGGILAGIGAIGLALLVGAPPARIKRPYSALAIRSPRPLAGAGIVAAWGGLIAGVPGLTAGLLASILIRWRYVPVIAFLSMLIAGAFWVIEWPVGFPDILAVFGAALTGARAIIRRGDGEEYADRTSAPHTIDPPSDQ